VTDRSVPIQLDRLRHLRYTFNDIADMQAVRRDIFERELSDFSVLRTVLWGGLRHEDPALQPYPAGMVRTGEIIEALLDSGQVSIADLASKCNEAISTSSTIKAVRKSIEEKTQATPQGEAGAPSKNLQGTGSQS